MLVHLGEDFMVPCQCVVAVLSLKAITSSRDSRVFLSWAEQGGAVRGDPHRARSLVLTDEGLILSPISAETLQDRLTRGINRFTDQR